MRATLALILELHKTVTNSNLTFHVIPGSLPRIALGGFKLNNYFALIIADKTRGNLLL